MKNNQVRSLRQEVVQVDATCMPDNQVHNFQQALVQVTYVTDSQEENQHPALVQITTYKHLQALPQGKVWNHCPEEATFGSSTVQLGAEPSPSSAGRNGPLIEDYFSSAPLSSASHDDDDQVMKNKLMEMFPKTEM